MTPLLVAVSCISCSASRCHEVVHYPDVLTVCQQVYRALAVIAAEGVNHLPKWCLAVAGMLMGAAVLVNLLKVHT